MPVAGLPKALETLLITCIEELDLYNRQISHTKNGCMLKINFNSGGHNGTGEPQIKPVTYKKKTPAQEKRDSKRIAAFKSHKSGYNTRSKDKVPATETVRKDSVTDHKVLDISPVSVESVASIDVHCSPILNDSHSDETSRSVKLVNNSISHKQDMLSFCSDDPEEVPLTFGVDYDSICNEDLISDCDLVTNESGSVDTDESAMDESEQLPVGESEKTYMDGLGITCVTDSKVTDGECPSEKPYSSCMNMNCDLAKLHPNSTAMFDHGYFKCNDCAINLCNFCLFGSGHMKAGKQMVYHHGTLS